MADSTTFNQALLEALDTYAARTSFYVKEDRMFQGVSFRYTRTQALRLSGYMHRYGLAEGDRVAILARNRVEWLTRLHRRPSSRHGCGSCPHVAARQPHHRAHGRLRRHAGRGGG